jgi:hypothetical protein
MNVARIVEVRNAHAVLVGKPKWKGSCWRLRCRWKDIKMRIRVEAGLKWVRTAAGW